MSLLQLFVRICGFIAPALSIIVFLSPIPTIYQIKQDESIGTLPLLPYTSMIGSTYLWVVYGLLKHETPIIIANFPGLILGICYVYIYIKYIPNNYSKLVSLPGTLNHHYIGMSLIVMISTLIPIISPYITKSIHPASVVGIGGVILCIILFASPLSTLKSVLLNRSAKSIPLPFTIMTVLNCFTWTIYGIFGANDPNLYVPNILGLSFGIIQVILKILFYHNDYVKYQHLHHDDSNDDASSP